MCACMCAFTCAYLAYLPRVLGPPFECLITSSVLIAQEAGGIMDLDSLPSGGVNVKEAKFCGCFTVQVRLIDQFISFITMPFV